MPRKKTNKKDKNISVDDINNYIRNASNKKIYNRTILDYIKIMIDGNNTDNIEIRYLFQRLQKMRISENKRLDRKRKNIAKHSAKDSSGFRFSHRMYAPVKRLINNIAGRLFIYFKKKINMTNIFKIFIEYIFIFGKSKYLVNMMIKLNMWYMIELINSITPISYKDIYISLINSDVINNLNNMGIYFTSDIKSLLLYNKYDYIIKYIEDNNLFKNKISFKNLCYVKDKEVLQYLTDNNMVSLKINDIKKYHKNCKLFIINHLIENNLIDEKPGLIKLIFGNQKMKKKIDNNTTLAKRYYASYRYRRRTIWKTRKYNKKSHTNEFRTNIKKYLSLISIEDIPNKRYMKNCILVNKMYDLFIDLINTENEKSFMIDSYDLDNLVVHCIKNDDIDRFKILIDRKVLMISIVHSKSNIILECIRYNAKKICGYIINDLKAKITISGSSVIWRNWYRKYSNSQNLRFIKELNIPLNKTILSSLLKRQASVKTIQVLINEFGMSINKSHMKYIVTYSTDGFYILTKNLSYNKKKLITTLLKINNKNWKHHRFSDARNKIALSLISKLNEKERNKLLPLFLSKAITTDNLSAIQMIKEKYNMIPCCTLIKKLIDNNEINSQGFDILKSLIMPKTIEADIKNLKKYFNKQELSKLCFYNLKRNMAGYVYNLSIKSNLKLVKKLDVQMDISDILSTLDFIEEELHNGYGYYSEKRIKNMIKLVTECIGISDIDKNDNCEENIIKLLDKKCGIEILLELKNKNYDFIKYVRGSHINSFILYCLVYRKFTVDMITKYFSHLITPYTYKIINSIPLMPQELKKILLGFQKIENRITEEDYEVLKKYRWIKTFNFDIIKNYEPKEDEIPKDLNKYIEYFREHIEFNDNDGEYNDNDGEYNIINDIDKALIDAQLDAYDKDIDNIDIVDFDDT